MYLVFSSHITTFILAHPGWVGIIAYWIFSAAVSSLPDPGPSDGRGYKWLFGFLNKIAGNIFGVVGSKIPGLTSQETTQLTRVTTHVEIPTPEQKLENWKPLK